MEYMSNSIFVIFLICEIILLVDTIRIFQLNNYKLIFNTKSLYFALTFLLTALPYIISFVLKLEFIFAEIILIGLWSIYLIIQNIFKRQKIVFTNRAIRLITLSIILLVSISVIVYKFARGALFINVIVIPFLIVISNYINSPIEKYINHRFIKKAKHSLFLKNPLVIGITGSYGKTSVKNILTQLLSIKYKVLMTPKSYNTLMGVCLSINNLLDQEIFIVEMGARRRGDISKICKFVNPKIGVVTGLAKQHLKTFKNIENIYLAKKELQQSDCIEAMFYNDLNNYLNKMKNEFHNSIGIIDMEYKLLGFDGEYQEFQFLLNNNTYTAKTKLIGVHNIENLLLCIKIATYLNVDILDIIEKIKTIESISNRCEVKHLDNNITLIDDSYNANIDGCISTLDFLNKFSGRKVVFAQGIVELGKDQYIENKTLGNKMAQIIDIAILLGVNKKAIQEGLIEKGFDKDKIICLRSFNEINKTFKNILKEGDVVLIQNDLTDNY